MKLETATPVLLLGGKENSLSIARHLGSLGIKVKASGQASCWAMYSRHCAGKFPVPRGTPQEAHWKSLLLGSDRSFDGHIVLALSDVAIEFILANRDALAARYRLDDMVPSIQHDLMDKQRTLELGRAADVGIPNFWHIDSDADIERALREVRFPAMVKPKQSHKFNAVFGGKLFIVESDPLELRDKIALCRQHGIDAMVVEMVPGPDSLLSSYYTYIDDRGRKLFRYTKRIIRRWPVHQGNACYHANDWLPETAAAAEKLLDHIGYRGLANVEFKRDTRDGQLKLIEVNTRITAAQELPVRAGIPIDLIIYRHLTGQHVSQYVGYRKDLRLWHPLRDFLCYLELRKSGAMTFGQWLKSVMTTSNILPLFSFSDPLPMAGAAYALLGKLVKA